MQVEQIEKGSIYQLCVSGVVPGTVSTYEKDHTSEIRMQQPYIGQTRESKAVIKSRDLVKDYREETEVMVGTNFSYLPNLGK